MPDTRSAASIKIEEARTRGQFVLDLAGLGLTELPEGIADLIHLEELYLSIQSQLIDPT